MAHAAAQVAAQASNSFKLHLSTLLKPEDANADGHTTEPLGQGCDANAEGNGDAQQEAMNPGHEAGTADGMKVEGDIEKN